MEEAELTEIPEAEVMEEREEWMNVHTWRDTMRWRTKLVSINKQRGASSQFGLRLLKFGQISINKHTEYIHMNKSESALIWYLDWDDYITSCSCLLVPYRSLFTSCSLTVPTDPVRRCWRWDDPDRRTVADVDEAELRECEEVCRAASSMLREAWGVGRAGEITQLNLWGASGPNHQAAFDQKQQIF